MKTNEIIAGLRHCDAGNLDACKECQVYNPSDSCLDVLHKDAADTLQLQKVRIMELEAELKDERHRHDRYVDFELAEAAELARVKAERRWIPVTERLPEQDGLYLCIISSSALRGSRYHTILPYDKAGFRTGYVYTDDVTHWMPLPEPPKEGL